MRLINVLIPFQNVGIKFRAAGERNYCILLKKLSVSVSHLDLYRHHRRDFEDVPKLVDIKKHKKFIRNVP